MPNRRWFRRRHVRGGQFGRDRALTNGTSQFDVTAAFRGRCGGAFGIHCRLGGRGRPVRHGLWRTGRLRSRLGPARFDRDTRFLLRRRGVRAAQDLQERVPAAADRR